MRTDVTKARNRIPPCIVHPKSQPLLKAKTETNRRIGLMPNAPVLIVTGGGRGIGAATARLGAARGYSVCVNYQRNASAANSVVDSIRAAGGRAIAVQADVSSEPDVVRMFETVDRELGTVRALVNNAATMERQMRVDEMDADRLQRMFGTNAIGPILCSREAVRRMSTKHGGKGGVIVNISSTASRFGSPGEFVDYAASKAAVETFTLGLAREVAEESIRVVAIRPGFIDTEMHDATGEIGRKERYRQLLPMKRLGRPEEVAAAVIWMLSEEASYVSGTVLDVAGAR
jgi:NAD(P)-dependent dehydrogenase (short-subunit alcohol dehydrogenase family)